MLGVPTHSPACIMCLWRSCTVLACCLKFIYHPAADRGLHSAAHLIPTPSPNIHPLFTPLSSRSCMGVTLAPPQVLSIFNYLSETPGLDPMMPSSLPHLIHLSWESACESTVQQGAQIYAFIYFLQWILGWRCGLHVASMKGELNLHWESCLWLADSSFSLIWPTSTHWLWLRGVMKLSTLCYQIATRLPFVGETASYEETSRSSA